MENCLMTKTFLEKIDAAFIIIKQTIDKYQKIALGCSFGKDSMVTLHLCLKIDPKIKVFSVLSNTEFPETYAFEKKIVKMFNFNYTAYRFEQDPRVKQDLTFCCGQPKIEETKKAVTCLDAWISGVRNSEGMIRASFKHIESKQGLIKINPIIKFTEKDIWRYLAVFNVPVNPIYQKGFRSLGCQLCSVPESIGVEDERAGRWKGTKKHKGECGIHTQSLR